MKILQINHGVRKTDLFGILLKRGFSFNFIKLVGDTRKKITQIDVEYHTIGKVFRLPKV